MPLTGEAATALLRARHVSEAYDVSPLPLGPAISDIDRGRHEVARHAGLATDNLLVIVRTSVDQGPSRTAGHAGFEMRRSWSLRR